MTDPDDPAAPPADRRTSKRSRAKLGDLTLIVRPPDPQAVRAFTADEADEAKRYATQTGGIVNELL